MVTWQHVGGGEVGLMQLIRAVLSLFLMGQSKFQSTCME